MIHDLPQRVRLGLQPSACIPERMCFSGCPSCLIVLPASMLFIGLDLEVQTMGEHFIEISPIPVLRLRADWKGAGPAAAFAALESKLPSLKGRKFYGVGKDTPEGMEYFACVARIDGDDPAKLGLESHEIPGGWYARRRIRDWERNIGQLAVQFKDMIRVLGKNVDASRPEIEFYRSQAEMFVFEPVKSAAVNGPKNSEDTVE
jgi:hypothetical protein